MEAASIGRLDNTGIIRGENNGISARGRIAGLNNRGTLQGDSGAGVSLGSGGRLENSGRITGGNKARGIFARGAVDLLVNKSDGTIEGKPGILIDSARTGHTTIDHAPVCCAHLTGRPATPQRSAGAAGIG